MRGNQKTAEQYDKKSIFENDGYPTCRCEATSFVKHSSEF